jgi:hypothetical protein
MVNLYIFMLLTPCIVDNLLTTHSPTKRTVLFPDILCYGITLNTLTCFDPLLGSSSVALTH